MNVITVATPFTIAGLHSSQVLEHAWMVHEPEALLNQSQGEIYMDIYVPSAGFTLVLL